MEPYLRKQEIIIKTTYVKGNHIKGEQRMIQFEHMQMPDTESGCFGMHQYVFNKSYLSF